jgi:DNA-binding MurR/RpiR family transcriptional regulator
VQQPEDCELEHGHLLADLAERAFNTVGVDADLLGHYIAPIHQKGVLRVDVAVITISGTGRRRVKV